jgi:aryl sulfotransferase
MLRDLASEMRRLALRLSIEVPPPQWPELVEAATFGSMRSHAAELSPSPAGILKSPAAFFRRGVSGSGRELLTDAEIAHYRDRVRRMAPQDLLEWLQR